MENNNNLIYWNMISRVVFFSGFLILFSSSLCGQKTWTLDECIEYALDNNIRLRQQEISVALQTNKFQESRFGLLPSLNFKSAHTNRFGRSVDPLTYQFTTDDTRGASISAYTSVDLFKGFQGLNSVKKNRLDLDIELADYEQAKNDLSLHITRFYLEILFYTELTQTAEKQIDITRQQREQTKRLVDSGSLPRSSLLEIEALIASEELAWVQADNELKMAVLNLSQLLELDSQESFDISLPFSFSMPDTLSLYPEDQILRESVAWMPRIKSAELSVQSAEKNLRIQQGRLAPNLSLTSGWGTGYSDQITDILSGNTMPFRDQLSFSSTTFLSFSLEIPVFNGLSGHYRVKDAQLGILASQLELEARKNEVEKEIRIASADARAAFQTYKASEKSLSSLELSFKETEKRFQLGMVTALDYNTAKNELAKALSEQLQAKYVYLFNMKILDFYKGL